MPLKAVKRSKLTEAINAMASTLKTGTFFVTCIRPTKDNSVQVEVCQKRKISGRQRTLLGVLNKSDDRFRDENTLLFDWLTFQPKDLLLAMPVLSKEVSLAEIKEIADKWTPTAPTGPESTVYQLVKTIEKIEIQDEDEGLTPIIRVTEVTESQLRNYQFFRGDDADFKIQDELDKEHNVMKTAKDGEYILDAESGDKVWRFARTEFVEGNGADIVIPNKVTETVYKRMQKSVPGSKAKKETLSPEVAIKQIHGSDQID